MAENKTSFTIKAFVIGMLVTLSSMSNAAVFVVDDNYNGVSSATACEQPAGATHYSTISDARIAASASSVGLPHTMRICPGTYTEDNRFNDANLVGMTIEGTTGAASDVQINSVNLTTSPIDLRQDKMILRDVSVAGGNYPVRTWQATGVQLDNLIVSKAEIDGILIQSADNYITNTLVENITRFGIYSTSFGDKFTVESTKVLSTGNTCIRSNRGDVSIKNVTLDGCGTYGVFLNKEAGLSDNLSINNLVVNDAVLDGLYVSNYDASAAGVTASIVDVQTTNTDRFGVYLINSDSVDLTNIKINQTGNYGAFVLNSVGSRWTNISTDTVGTSGIYLNQNSHNNQMTGVSIDNSTSFGLYVNGGDGNTFEDLSIKNSSGTAGVLYNNESRSNVIKGYEVASSGNIGVYLVDSDDNVFVNGIIHSNVQGIFLTNSATNNEFTNNYVHNNSSYGLRITANGDNENNAFYSNCFINPSTNVSNLESGVSNIFDNGVIGNFYGSSPAGTGYSEVCFDPDTNAICDVGYPIPGGSTDVDNFPSRDLTVLDAACFSDAVVAPSISLTKTSAVVSDPVNLNVNPKAIPGSVIAYKLEATNTGVGDSDPDSITLVDNLPPNTRLILGSPASPVVFADGVPASGLSYTFSGLASTTDDVDFSNDGGATFVTPIVDANGVDVTAPRINFIKVSPKGVLKGDTGAGAPSFSVTFEVELN